MNEIDFFGTKKPKKEAQLLTRCCRFITIQFISEKLGREENSLSTKQSSPAAHYRFIITNRINPKTDAEKQMLTSP